METLSDTLGIIQKTEGMNFFQNLVPKIITSNLKSSFVIRPYQMEAFGRFVYYWEHFSKKHEGVGNQLLFHMATGSGKTLIMAGLMLYLYQQGYRDFLFFVNSTNIIKKTRENFLNPNSGKYVFAETLSMLDKRIHVYEVQNFQYASREHINICFCTVQGLHSMLNTPRENSLTYDDFEGRHLVLIADEAHHINAETRKGKILLKDEEENLHTWEATVTRVFNANARNILLEFTATAGLQYEEIRQKYKDKLLFDYSLFQFRADGYSKEVQTLQTDLPVFERALQALLLSQYRRKLFEGQGLSIKPVVLFKAKTIKDSRSFQQEFSRRMRLLSISDLMTVKENGSGTIIERFFEYCSIEQIDLNTIVEELKNDFSTDKLLSVNSQEESEEKQIAVNTLEEYTNEYRAIFAVDKLNEGWDVLNLFDIVRLYDTRISSKVGNGRSTIQEAQLIGRGARYCPFRLDERQDSFIRKFDDDLSNPYRICEELYFHASFNPYYIQELHQALVQIGIKASLGERKCAIKKIGKWKRREINDWSQIFCRKYEVLLQMNGADAQQIFHIDSKQSKSERMLVGHYSFLDLGERILRKAMCKHDFYRFDNLRKFFPKLTSVNEFLNSSNYLGGVVLRIVGMDMNMNSLSPSQKLRIAVDILDEISEKIISRFVN